MTKREKKPKSYDGAVMKALRYRQFGQRSSSLLAKMLSDKTGYTVYREHISAYENGKRALVDPIVEALASIFGVEPGIFPEYAARHIHPEVAAHPLVAWALQKATKMSPGAAHAFLTKTEGSRGRYSTLMVESLRNEGVVAVDIPRAALRA